MASSLPLSFVADLSSYLDEGEVVAFKIGPDGYAYVVIAQKPLGNRITFANGVTTGKTIPALPQQYRVLAFSFPIQTSLRMLLTLLRINFKEKLTYKAGNPFSPYLQRLP